MVNFPYGDHFGSQGAKMTENSVFSCFQDKNRLFGPKGCLNRENCLLKEDLPLKGSCFESSHQKLRGPERHLSTQLWNLAGNIVHKLTKSNGN